MKALFTSWKATLILLAHYIVLLAVATLIESRYGAIIARKIIYNNLFFYLLQLLLIIHFCFIAHKSSLWRQRKYGIFFMHLSFIIILSGALITNLFGFEGVVHLRQGDVTSYMTTAKGEQLLPFSIRLDKFKLVRYPGSHSPSSFESFLTISSCKGERSEHIYMNKVIYEQGYRLYQSSYDSDEQGTVLTLNNDMPGTIITYIGYLLLLLSIPLILTDKKSHFRRLVEQLRRMSTMLLFLLFPVFSFAQNPETKLLMRNTIPAEQAEQWGRLQVQSPIGRIEPVNTYTDKLLRKIYRSNSFEGLSSEQVIMGFIINPAYWDNIPIIYLANKELAKACSLPETKYLRFLDVFDDKGKYLIANDVDRIYASPVRERSRLEREILRLDEKVNILYSLRQGTMLALFPLPEDKNGKWYSSGDDLNMFSPKDSLFVSKIIPWYADEAFDALRTNNWEKAKEILSMINIYQQRQSGTPLLTESQLSWELFYNKMRFFFWSAIGYVFAGLLLLFLMLWQLLKPKRWLKPVVLSLIAFIVLIFLLHTLGIASRWYISGHAPWTNTYESMVYVAWATSFAGLLFSKRSFIALALATLFAGIILFVANLNSMDPEITPLIPVLKSYWLMIHVAVITASYGFFGMSFLIGLLTLVFMCMNNFKKKTLMLPHIRKLRVINEISLHIGLYLLTAGILFGAVWANESWGRYWGWDPKETWALITLLVYVFILHARFLPVLCSDYVFSVMSVSGLISVLMTYFGVNYYLSGLHSYGGDAPRGLIAIFVAYIIIFILAVYAGYRQHKR